MNTDANPKPLSTGLLGLDIIIEGIHAGDNVSSIP